VKISEQPLEKLFESFQHDMVKMTQDTFNSMYPNSPEPIVFIATTNQGTKKMMDQHPDLAKDILMASPGVIPYDPNDEKLSVLGLPLGTFFQDTGSEKMNYLGKVYARLSIWKAIQAFESIEPGCVLFVAFISECVMRALKGNITDEEIEYIKKHGISHIDDHEFAKEDAFVLLMESKDGMQRTSYLGIERNDEDGHQFLYKRNPTDIFGKQDPKADEATPIESAGGLFSNFFKEFKPNE
jgi:hypothetical protein